jgi:cell division septum initiation protein DivIVA
VKEDVMDIVNVIDRLEALVNTSRKMPATRNRLVDAEKVMELVEQLRLSIPQDVRAAQEVLERKDAILNQSQVDARRTRAEAEEEFRTRLDQNELVVSARHKADGLIEEAEQKANRIMQQAEAESTNNRADADAYSIQALRNLERELTSVLGAVRTGLDTLGANVRV